MLWTPHATLSKAQNNLSATPVTTGPGTTVTGTTANVKGNFIDLIASLDYDVYSVSICATTLATTGTVTDCLMDLAIHGSAAGAGSAGTIVWPNMVCGFAPNAGDGVRWMLVDFPLYLPKGHAVRARVQTVILNDTVIVGIWANGAPSLPGLPVFKGADAIGVATATSRGTDLTTGSTGTESAWTSIGTVTTRAYHGIIPMGIGAGGRIAAAGLGHHFEFGYSSTTFAEYYVRADSTERIPGLSPPAPMYFEIPAGTQLQFRGESSGTGESMDMALYGLY